MEHTVYGISKMHVPLIQLRAGVCQPKQKCADCTTNDTWLMGLDVRCIYCSKFLFSSLLRRLLGR
jgi:hypothetical protein